MSKILDELKDRLGSVRGKLERQKIRKEIEDEIKGERGKMANGDRAGGGEHDEFEHEDIRKSMKDEADSRKDLLRSIHDMNDSAYMIKVIKGDMAAAEFLQRKQFVNVRKAMDTTENPNWIPTGMSGTLIDMVRDKLLVANLFNEETMPTSPYDPPVLAGGMTGYLVDESTSDSGTKPTVSGLTDGKATLTAKKIAARAIVSSELEEDSIVQVLPRIRTEISRALSEAEENAIVNGDTTSPHASADVDPDQTWASSGGVSDARYAFDGLRKELLANSLTRNMATFTTTTLSQMILDLGVYNNEISDLVWICGVAGEHKFRTLADAAGNLVMMTLDKYGPNAVILKGEIGNCMGIPVVRTGKLVANQNSSGIYDPGSPNDGKSSIMLVHRPSFLRGDRRRITVKTKEDIETDQMIVVSNMRKAFRTVRADGQTYGCLGINIS